MPTPIGTSESLVINRKGTRNCDQPAITVMMKAEATPGVDRGRMMRMKTERRLQPSIRAASSRLFGMPSMYPLSSQVTMGTPRAI